MPARRPQLAWFKRFASPIPLPDGSALLTLQDAAEYVSGLPKAEQDAVEWQIALAALVAAAERGGYVPVAWTAVNRALNQGKPPSPEPPSPESPRPKPRLRIVR